MTDRNAALNRGHSSRAESAGWRNVSGETIPAHAVVQFRTNIVDGESQASKPDGGQGLYFVNGPIPVLSEKAGESLVWGKARLVLMSGNPTVGTTVGPTAGSWEMSDSGQGFIVMHQPVDGVAAVVLVGGGGGTPPIHGIVRGHVKPGYYEVEISEWDGVTPSDNSGICENLGGGGSGSGDNCDEDQTPPEFDESQDSETPDIVKRQTVGTGVIVLAYDSASKFIPLELHTDCLMQNLGDENPTVGTEDDSQSSGNMEPVYQIVRGHHQHIVTYSKEYQCCPTTGEWRLIARTPYILMGVVCPEEMCEPCPE